MQTGPVRRVFKRLLTRIAGLQVKNGILLTFLYGFGHHSQNGQFIHMSVFFLSFFYHCLRGRQSLSLAVDIMDICHCSEYSGQSKYDLFCVLPALFPTLMIPTLTSLVSGTSKCACYSKLVGKEYFQCFQINSQDYLCSKVCKFIHIFKLTFNTAIGKRREKKEENTLCPLPWALEGNSPM